VRPPCPALAALALGLLSPASPARAQAAGGDDPPAQTPLAVLTGRIRSVDLARHVVVLDVVGDPVTLGLDRNTLVYLPTGLATVQALEPGAEVRAGRNGKDVAYWIEVRSAAGGPAPPSTPGQGTGPGGGSPAPPERAGPAPATPSTGTPR
jgi:hypothetical protein